MSFRFKSSISLALIFSLSFALNSANAATIKPKTSCNFIGERKIFKSMEFICKKNGKKLAWFSYNPKTIWATPKDRKVIIPSKLPSSFSDLVESSQGIAYSAWLKFNSIMKSEPNKSSKLEYYVGPNTNHWFKNESDALNLVLRVHPSHPAPEKILLFKYGFKDLQWAKTEVKKRLTESEYNEAVSREGEQFIDSNCHTSEAQCDSGKAMTFRDGLSLVLIGSQDYIDPRSVVVGARISTGMLEAHEFYHLFQDISFRDKDLTDEQWPLRWFTEGSATLIQNAVINANSYNDFDYFHNMDCTGECMFLNETQIKTYLSLSKTDPRNSEFEQYLAYNLGSRAVEALVSVKGIDSLIMMWEEMSKGIGWNAAFMKVYGTDWDTAYPIIASALAQNIRNFN